MRVLNGVIFEIKKQLRFKIVLTFILLVSICAIGSAYYSRTFESNNWRRDTEIRLQDARKSLKEDKKEKSGLKAKLIADDQNMIKISEYRLKHNISSATNVFSFINDMFSFYVILLFTCVIIASGQIGKEITFKTFEPLVLSSNKEYNIILNKIISYLVDILILEVIYVGISGVIGYFFFKQNGINLLNVDIYKGNVVVNSYIFIICKEIFITWLLCASFGIFVICISLLSCNQLFSACVGIALFYLINMLSGQNYFNKFLILYDLSQLMQVIGNISMLKEIHFYVYRLIIQTVCMICIDILLFRQVKYRILKSI